MQVVSKLSAEYFPKSEEAVEQDAPPRDNGVRRHRVFNFDFDSRASILMANPRDILDNYARKELEKTQNKIRKGISFEFGAHSIDQKIKDFVDFGDKPLSIVSHHNAMFDQVRTAFVSGAYYAALTGACALGERMLNHLILDLRHHYKSSVYYKRIYAKESFDDWSTALEILDDWQVLLPDVKSVFVELQSLRNRSIHFNLATSYSLRADALLGAHHLMRIIGAQFCAIGLQPWFIEGIQGASFIKRDWERKPFVAHYYCTNSCYVGPFHSMNFDQAAGWSCVDFPDYGEFGIDCLTDEQFREVFNMAGPAVLARVQ